MKSLVKAVRQKEVRVSMIPDWYVLMCGSASTGWAEIPCCGKLFRFGFADAGYEFASRLRGYSLVDKREIDALRKTDVSDSNAISSWVRENCSTFLEIVPPRRHAALIDGFHAALRDGALTRPLGPRDYPPQEM